MSLRLYRVMPSGPRWQHGSRYRHAIRQIIIAFACTAAALAEPALRSPVTGPARVIDGDTVVVVTSIGDVHVRLKGVDAAEIGTVRGDDARDIMRGIVGNEPLTCHLTGEHTWHREVGYCFTADGTDINREIIAMGAALACPRYDVRYVGDEQPEALAEQRRSSYCVRQRVIRPARHRL